MDPEILRVLPEVAAGGAARRRVRWGAAFIDTFFDLPERAIEPGA